ncbi:MAG: tetratricopeptide repeat protein [Terracidiphilus sp.]
MKDDINPGPVFENASQNAGAGLAGAFEQLIQRRSAGTYDPGHEEPESARDEDAAGRCPDPGDWARLLGDEARPGEAAKVNALLAHAAVCRVCAERVRALAADISPEENAALAGLGFSLTERQRKLAAQLAGTPVQFSSKRPSRLYLWTGAGLAASLLIGVWLISWWREANNPENLLAEAYTHERIFDMRMPGAGFAEVTPKKHLRGGVAGRESAKLQDAQDRIEQQLAAAPEDEHWLQLEARSDILEEKFDQAIDILDRLVAAGPVSESLLLDDASAYFERGEATGSENDRATALDILRRADEMAPGDPVVLFNEAVAMEDRGQAMNAVETWNRYLRFERDPRWLAEGRRRLEALEQKLKQLKTHSSQPQAN